jgi:peptide/nickel transport system permease protein
VWRFAVRRLVFIPIIGIVISTGVFVLLRAWPEVTGDPAVMICGMNCPEERLEGIRAELGLDRPITVQYVDWMGDVVTGNLGTTIYGGQDVLDEVVRRLPISFEIMFLTLLFGGTIGISFGILSAVMRNTPLDYGVRVLAVFGQSVPDFFLLVLLIVIPSILWNYAAPVGGYVALWDDPWTNLRMFVPPTLVLSVGGAAGLMRLVRSTMLEVLRSDYVRTAKAKGLHPWTVVLRHAFRNTLAPTITVLTYTLTIAFSGTVILEVVMSVNGLGAFFFNSVLRRDLPVVQFIVLYTALIVVFVNLLQDLSYAYIDPRVRFR